MRYNNVLVVGGAGYIGSHMVQALLEKGCRVVILDNLSTGHRDLVAGGIFFHGSLGDAATLNNIFALYRIDAVMHFAACSLVGESVENPRKYYHNNLVLTFELLHAMLRHEVRNFIFSSTAAVYGEPRQVPISEAHPCQPTNPYGATKLAVERLLHDYGAAYGLRSICLRYFNAAGAHESGVIGERHIPESHLIPLVLKAAAGEREAITIFGTDYPTADGTCVRDYVHVSDLVQAHMLALDALLNGGASATYNLGNTKGYSVRQVIEAAEEVTGRPIPVVEAGRRTGDPAVLIADSQRVRNELGWQPRYEGLAEIIRTAWQWHQRDSFCRTMLEGSDKPVDYRGIQR